MSEIEMISCCGLYCAKCTDDAYNCRSRVYTYSEETKKVNADYDRAALPGSSLVN